MTALQAALGQPPRLSRHVVRALLLLAAMLLAVGLAQALKPTRQIADRLPPIDLQAQVPLAFAGWQLDPDTAPVVPDPSLQERLDSVYDQTLARSYVNAAGDRVMLTIAYGRNQSSEATAVHRPEFCYGAQGFRVRSKGIGHLALATGGLTVHRLVATLGTRVEPISYWVTLADQATLPGLGRKWAQLRMGLAGDVADGMLVRASTLGMQGPAPYAAQDRFLRDLAGALPPGVRARYFGS
ncbi:MAG: EpsI family protein [Rhizobacter sp.]|nr:EpsI family protein [Rhizobacter sp.]